MGLPCRAVVALCLVLAAPAMAAAPVTAKAAAAAKALTGIWELVRYENTGPDGTVTTPFGAHPKGYFIYDPTGHLSIQIMRTPPVAPFTAGDDLKGTDAEVRDAYAAYAAYFGTWRINPEGTAVIHVVEGALRPSYTGTEQVRPFTLDGDKLVIRPAPGEYRELRRVR